MAFNKVVPNKQRSPTVAEVIWAMKTIQNYGLEQLKYPDLYNDLITAIIEENDSKKSDV